MSSSPISVVNIHCYDGFNVDRSNSRSDVYGKIPNPPAFLLEDDRDEKENSCSSSNNNKRNLNQQQQHDQSSLLSYNARRAELEKLRGGSLLPKNNNDPSSCNDESLQNNKSRTPPPLPPQKNDPLVVANEVKVNKRECSIHSTTSLDSIDKTNRNDEEDDDFAQFIADLRTALHNDKQLLKDLRQIARSSISPSSTSATTKIHDVCSSSIVFERRADYRMTSSSAAVGNSTLETTPTNDIESNESSTKTNYFSPSDDISPGSQSKAPVRNACSSPKKNYKDYFDHLLDQLLGDSVEDISLEDDESPNVSTKCGRRELSKTTVPSSPTKQKSCQQPTCRRERKKAVIKTETGGSKNSTRKQTCTTKVCKEVATPSAMIKKKKDITIVLGVKEKRMKETAEKAQQVKVCCTNSKWVATLHKSRGGCDRCLQLASVEDRKNYQLRGHHPLIMSTRGGCSQGCKCIACFSPRNDVGTKEEEESPPSSSPCLRLCLKCFNSTHNR